MSPPRRHKNFHLSHTYSAAFWLTAEQLLSEELNDELDVNICTIDNTTSMIAQIHFVGLLVHFCKHSI